MSKFETVLVYISKYGERNMDVEIAVELHGSASDIQRGKRALESAIEGHFSARRGRPQPRVRYNVAVEDRGEDKTKRRGYKDLFAGTSGGKPITDLQLRVASSLNEAYRLPEKRKRGKK